MNNTYNNPYGGNSYGFNPYPSFGSNRIDSPYNGGNGVDQRIPQMNSQPLQNQFNNLQPVGLKGRMVVKEEDITAGEIPMDNSLSLFPLTDYSCIYAKQWQPNGTITTVKYVPETPVQETHEPTINENGVLDELNERLSNIEHMLKQQRKPRNNYYKKNQNGSNYHKKEVDNA